MRTYDKVVENALNYRMNDELGVLRIFTSHIILGRNGL